MKRVLLAVAVAVLAPGCGDTTAGRLCSPGDPTFCGDGFHCLTFCDKDTGPESICTPSFGAEAGEVFANEALIDGKAAFGQLGNTRVFEQNLRIEIPDVKGVALPLLEEVAGNLTIRGTDVECLSMPRLRRVGGTMTISLNPNLSKAQLGSLQDTGGLALTENASLSSLALSATTSITGDVIVSGNAALEFIQLDALARIDGDLIVTNNAVQQLDLTALTEVSGCIDVEYHGVCATPPALDGVECCAGERDGQQVARRSGCDACR